MYLLHLAPKNDDYDKLYSFNGSHNGTNNAFDLIKRFSIRNVSKSSNNNAISNSNHSHSVVSSSN